ncbi:MAG TPA: cellobiose phosphorylase [Clostridiales bacterium]|nr:cellobiose phosphorylase [Clostridiales bacterium]
MTLTHKKDCITFDKGAGRFSFLPTGDIFEFTYEDFLINGYWGNCIDGSVNNIYLRVYNGDRIAAYPLLGRQSRSELLAGRNVLVHRGCVDGISYKVAFHPAKEDIWFWIVDLSAENKTADLIYGQDAGVALKGGVLTNELYMSQYLDHMVIKGENGYTVSSRQNLSQGGRNPYLQQGSLNTEIIGFSTDATQFFGNEYRKTYIPKVLYSNLPNVNYQFELAYIALQTAKMTINGNKRVVFYGIFKPDQPQPVTEILYAEELLRAYKSIQDSCEILKKVKKPPLKLEFGTPFVSEEFSENEICKLFTDRKLEEKADGKLLSFFTTYHTHVVLQQKEVLVERPHGHIICTRPDMRKVSKGLISSTNYMYGIFHSQLTAGNTSFNKLLSNARGFLNIIKNSGQRIFVKVNGVYRILTLPAAYEMGICFSKWYYKIEDDIIIVTAFVLADRPAAALQVSSRNGRKYDFIITNQLAMGEHEYFHPANILNMDGTILISKTVKEPWDPYPDLNFAIHATDFEYKIADDRIFFADGKPRNGTMLTIQLSSAEEFQLIIEGRMDRSDSSIEKLSKRRLDKEFKRYADHYRKLFSKFHLSGPESEQIEILNEIIWWYTHDALIHFAVPHGLEQPGGAAWGTRDVCQGPMEFFLANGHFDLMRDVLLRVFAHQYLETKEWPQWFMFDKFNYQAEECHGDVVFWPLKSLGDYLLASNDISILQEKIPYRLLSSHMVSEEKTTLLQHVKEAVETIEARFVGPGALVNYAGGDWDDTLQPADPSMKERLVSAWTVALAYQTLNQLAKALDEVEPEYSAKLKGICSDIRESFHEVLIKDGIPAGFVYFNDDNTIEYMLHPLDQKTGIKYRLLPLTRSIIAEMVDREQAEKNVDIINNHLSFPDGVRLMDRPARYAGGVSRYFQRAEQAANVGREISLQYVHAHIRYIEAMSKLGKAEKAWEAMFKINPILIKKSVPNAELRQSNTYFSSSEGAYLNRYDYQEYFDKLRDGSIKVKGGWRIYSSGPGLYVRQLVSHLLGIRFAADSLIIDPVLPDCLDGLRFDFMYSGYDISFVYHMSSDVQEVSVFFKDHKIQAKKLDNPYRPAGVSIDGDLVRKLLKDHSVFDIYLPLMKQD